MFIVFPALWTLRSLHSAGMRKSSKFPRKHWILHEIGRGVGECLLSAGALMDHGTDIAGNSSAQ